MGVVLVLADLALLASTLRTQTAANVLSFLSEEAQRGKAIFTDRCFVCHDGDSERVPRLPPPPLDGLYQKHTLINGKPVNDTTVTEMIKFGTTPAMTGLFSTRLPTRRLATW